MLRQHTRVPRISGAPGPSVRPHLTPTSPRRTCRRPFTQKPPLLTLSPQRSRPQLAFLSPSPISRALPPLSVHLQQHYARLVSTESRGHFKKRASRVLRISLSLGAILVFYEIIKIGIYQEELEHKWPTPSEWSWKSRWCLRAAEAWQNPEEIGRLMSDWPMVAGYCKELISRLEDVNGDGKGIVEQEEGGLFIDGVGKAGFDITAKSEPWRRGYFQALMGAAKAAENLEGWLTDRKQRVSASAEYFVGPSNPRPKPVPVGQLTPREEDSEPASPSPEVFYMKILTTRGFETGQKIDAALAYADWLDYKGLQSTAADMYTWAMDIAASGSPTDATKVVDLKTGIIKSNAESLPSENILRVSTALAVHNARHGNLPTALSIFASVLKARRASSPPPTGTVFPTPPYLPKQSNDIFVSFFNTLKTVFIPAQYPPPPPSGNEPPYRTPSSPCDEAGLMTYIGEIIYATHFKELGLAWTRDAVDLAESTLPDTDPSARENRCVDCLRVGFENWRTMVAQFLEKAQKDEEETIAKAKNGSSWFGPSKKQIEAKAVERKRWEAEQFILQERFRKLLPIIENDSAIQGVVPGVGLF
ncbi:uncharacterized protein DSM5745_02824 [Aspergillus mulundensis]|uniref:MFS maltose permease n=1 Tax=Aspergillus mulundensis TaxID=1810919 RepID=A0A3D8SIT0_9EURO|nr:Uncharacterized protein DSM5745_02824 [Aspergillus mulundensis]RDW86182.1 Uncharacterized protein DSM5745_02824 [Aspergillus mulundensis]